MSIRLQRKDGFARLGFSRGSVPFGGDVLVLVLIVMKRRRWGVLGSAGLVQIECMAVFHVTSPFRHGYEWDCSKDLTWQVLKSSFYISKKQGSPSYFAPVRPECSYPLSQLKKWKVGSRKNGAA